MNFLKDLFNNIEVLLMNLVLFDYSKIIILFAFISIVYLIHFTIIKLRFKKNVSNTIIELKKINIEASYYAKRKHLFFFYLYGFLTLSFLYISKDNLSIFLPVLTGFMVILIFSLKEQLNNIFLGFLFKSSISTTIYEGMEFYKLDNQNEYFKIVKINLFKSILKNERSGHIESIENKDLNSLHIIHKPLKSLNYVSFKYIVLNDYNLNDYILNVEEKFKEYSKLDSFKFSDIRNEIFNIKEKYNTSPYLKPFFDLDINMKDKDCSEIFLKLTVYNYNYEEYLKDFLYFKPN